ncbi:hypothetical protein POSPLADRAFT_1147337 [Postia placenta MAD-698-R-SB12]|uniref:Cation/H+ exchanger transmembrane domain-containing protein n=1 Tax=Postia placenta MAD-698-R-SB12 TaxID=670580 RepID=A0A1X6MWS6_9APHY|nr:hypothetical protein POSPLADRAFT_1147337 [Postia placenta MAD-698-R-SB12]OSX60686.1 hypothetical protein POSPLADRAFT_1147337 [Postia placenta MAD-698-R-SB12]
MSSFFPYSQPSLPDLLIIASFIYLLNVVRIAADLALHAGIVAELFLGMVYGSPLAGILPWSWETTFIVMGYLGLVLIVFEGDNLPVLLSNLPLSCLCALTGIGLPLALSFAFLRARFGYAPLEAFAAGAALSSTSLGTTLAALNSQTRIGTVLISAAIIDDVVGLVIAALIPALAELNGTSSVQKSSHLAWTLICPLLSSLLIALLTPLVARFILRPLFWFHNFGEMWYAVKLGIMVCTLSAFTAIAYYTGSSMLFGAYISGLTLSYVARPHVDATTATQAAGESDEEAEEERVAALSFEHTFARTIGPLQQYVLAPLFFASIGYAIPFLSLWKPVIIWRGVVYALLMCVCKLAVGLPILAWILAPCLYCKVLTVWRHRRCIQSPSGAHPPEVAHSESLTQLLSATLHPAAFIGIAMVSRGEIGLLIAEIAHQGGGPTDSAGLLDEEAFLICIWAILLCTLIGPVGVGFVVRRWGREITDGVWA